MPPQTTYFEQQSGDKRLVVVKSYDATFAHESFEQLDRGALSFLSSFHRLTDVPAPEEESYSEAIWEEIQEGAREDWHSFSYFIVMEEKSGQSTPLYVSSDWPSAEAFTKQQLAA